MATFISNGEPITQVSPQYDIPIVSNNGVVKARHQSGLPLGYTRLEYIEFDGHTYIDTGITPLNSGATINMKITPSTIDNLQFLYGQNPTDGMQQVGCFLNTTGKISWQYSALRRLVTDVVAVGTTYDITLGNGFITINGTTITGTPYTPFTTNMTVLVGAAWSPNYTYVDARRFVGKVYAFSYKLGGQTLVNLVPAKNSSNVVGMYDLVSGQFFTNAGTGDFTAGDPVSDPVEIYTDGTVETVEVHSKNLFDKNASYALFSGYLNNAVIGQNSFLNAYNGGDKTIIIKVAPNTTYTVTRATNLHSVYDRIRCAAFTTLPVDKLQGVMLCNYMNATQANATFTTLSDTQYVAINVRNSGAVGDDWTQYVDAFQVELGSTATAYEPYFNGGTATTEMLLKVGDYQDVQSIIDGSITRNVGVKVLDGTENWVKQVNSARYGVILNDSSLSENFIPISSHFVGLSANTPWAQMYSGNCKKEKTTSTYYFQYDTITTIQDWKQWLQDQYNAGTPVLVIYPLAEPTTETVTGQPLSIHAGTNIVEITQASIDNLELEVSYKGTV